ncbi:ASKHA domain-containing protein [Metaclostridioides mangenotii]|uniref:ASKHA domain-containing protein n=1 Tax=Metaclostridioides mangenotii TaxID=1540 RepID=UPI0028EA98D9|nr:ASKHA domain-containing protein [Clostridioides mangenotii]
MPKIDFLNESRCIEVEEGILLLDAIRSAGLDIETPCNGSGTCGKCKVIATGQLSDPNESEKKMIDLDKEERLSCMTLVYGDVEVEVIKTDKNLKTINRGKSIELPVDSSIKVVKLPNIDRYNKTPYIDTLNYDVNSLKLYNEISKIDFNYVDNIWGIVFEEELLNIDKNKKRILGVSIDIGTTGISYYLIDLESGDIIDKFSSLNPQTKYGSDVLTRITFCMENSNGAELLQELIVEEINLSIKTLASRCNLALDDIYHITVAANTTMMHLLLGISPKSLAKSPYRPVFLETKDTKATNLGIKTNEEAILSIVPAASAYIGGDILAGIIALDLPKYDGAVFIDIGTNGELAALKDGKIICTSTAAGPALEGMNIECGCRAEKGAIESFSIDEDYNMNYETISDSKAKGICGSGLIDIAASLVNRNILTKTGRWNKNLDERISDRLKDKKFYITDDVYISQKDIRQIQLAKGAISTGVVMMLKEIDLKLEEVSKVFIAGAFGFHINPDSIRSIGLIPKEVKTDIEFLGNTSLEGARLALINRECLKGLHNLNGDTEVLELSLKPEFQEEFIRQLNF